MIQREHLPLDNGQLGRIEAEMNTPEMNDSTTAKKGAALEADSATLNSTLSV